MNAGSAPAPLETHPRIDQWIVFEADRRVTVRSGRVEIGQGVSEAIAAIAADELDAPPGRVDVAAGDTRACPNEGVTAGSLSIAVGGMAARWAASAARRVLLTRAAELLQSRADDLTIEDGVVLRAGQDTGLDLWGLSRDVDLSTRVVDHASPKAPGDRRRVGAPLERRSLLDRLAGGFIHDLAPAGMAHGRAIHPPSFRGRLLSIDLAALEARPGVIAVVRDGSFLGLSAEREHLADAAVEWARRNGVWSDDGSNFDPVEALREAEPPLEIVHEAGAVDAAEGTAFRTVTTRPPLAHGSIGPACAIATWRDGRLEVVSHSQGVFNLRAALAETLGLDPASVDVIHRPGAGCYGHNGADDVALDAALLARRVEGRPVRVLWSRWDEFGTAPLGAPMATSVSATVTNAGRIAAMSVIATSAPHTSRPAPGAPRLRAAYEMANPPAMAPTADVPPARGGGADRNAVPLYDVPALRVGKRIATDLPIRTSAIRGLGAHLNVYAIETTLDDVARALGLDPVRLRLDHLSEPRARAVLERAAEMADWSSRPNEEAVGYGVGLARYKNRAGWCAVAARVALAETVRVTHAFAAVDVGEAIDPDGVAAQVEGGILQAASWTLKEGLRFEGEAVAQRTWDDYPILRFPETPEIRVAVLPSPDAAPLGAGEIAQGPAAAAIGNAVADVLGVAVRRLPIDRDAILAALEETA